VHATYDDIPSWKAAARRMFRVYPNRAGPQVEFVITAPTVESAAKSFIAFLVNKHLGRSREQYSQGVTITDCSLVQLLITERREWNM
jgi:hypothetical protein